MLRRPPPRHARCSRAKWQMASTVQRDGPDVPGDADAGARRGRSVCARTSGFGRMATSALAASHAT